uniref:uncharacterized protein LOC109967895 isoform X2 n=1 Tax=Monopterus albus TaxID=43700 RepID=UPI0009B4A620|nr:uncharacterized protein LOC109967895 isoform X2 [Monopterus albus]
MRAVCLHGRAKACPHLSTYRAVSSRTDVPGMDTGQWRCSSQLLHLSVLIPPSSDYIHSSRQQYHCPRQSHVPFKVYRGHPLSLTVPHRSSSSLCIKTGPDIVPTKRVVPGFTTRFTGGNLFKERRFLQVSEGYLVPEDPPTSHIDTTKIKQQNEEQKEVGLSLLRCIPFGEQNQRELAPDIPLRQNEARNSSSGLVVSSTDPRGKRLCKDTLGNKKQMGVLPSVTKPSGIMKLELPRSQSDMLRKLQVKDIRQCDFGREIQKSTATKDAICTRLSQSAPL